ncbi:hypothetical protein [Methylobacterium sp. NEAU K]|uniref:hypothetical protein n=1 Tax=Methylobacterium sp. NEAU K TaxID=3064946 RepID=UPI002733BFCB|nr:hypothetical protein [Methylobacterium sp. NEAU K]MDP4006819.1 hypothetical protein [Methylobacterium sp. NEAU K]
MPYVLEPALLALPGHRASWATDLLTFEEADRHLSQLTRIPGCGCLRYSNFRSRAHTRVRLPGGITKEIAVARLMCVLSADRPLGPDDIACHSCHQEECCHPDHIYAGTRRSNGRDIYRQDMPIRKRRAPRFYDGHLLRIAEQPPSQWPLTPPKPKPIPFAERLRLALDVPEYLKTPHPPVMRATLREDLSDLSLS